MDWAVIPAAGLGTRLMPVTKTVPKELIPVLDRPTIQYGVDEAIQSGITQIVLIVSETKKPWLEHYFSRQPDLEALLEAAGKGDLARQLASLHPSQVKFHYVIQDQPLGLGHAVSLAEPLVGKQPFAVLLPDEVLLGTPACTAQLGAAFKRWGKQAVAVRAVPDAEVRHYGILEVRRELEKGVVEASRILEKPKPDQTPSRWSLPGRYVFSSEIFSAIRELRAKPGHEVQLSEAISNLAGEGKVCGVEFRGDRFDVGNLEGLVRTNQTLFERGAKR